MPDSLNNAALLQQLAQQQHPLAQAVDPNETVRNIQQQLAQQQIAVPTAAPLTQNTASMVAPHQGGMFDSIGQFGVGQQQAQAERDRNAQQSVMQQGNINRQLMKDRLAQVKQMKASKANMSMFKAFNADPKKRAWLMKRFGDLSEGIAAGTVNMKDVQNAYAADIGQKENRFANEASQRRLMKDRAAFNTSQSNSQAKKTFDALVRLNPTIAISENLLAERENNPVAALSALKNMISQGKSARRSINITPFKKSPNLLENSYFGGADQYALGKINVVNPNVANNPQLANDLNEEVFKGVKSLIQSSNAKKGTMASFIDQTISSKIVDTKHGRVMKVPYQKGWVNIVGQEDGKVHTINVNNLDVNSNHEILLRAKLVAGWLGDSEQNIGVVINALLNDAKAKDGGLVDDVSWADAHSVIQFTTSQDALGNVARALAAIAGTNKNSSHLNKTFGMNLNPDRNYVTSDF